MSMTYIIVAFATVLLNNVFLSLFSFKVRIIFGYAISLSTLVFVALCEVAWHMFTAQTAYAVNLVAVSLTAVGCTGNAMHLNDFAIFVSKYCLLICFSSTIEFLWIRKHVSEEVYTGCNGWRK